MGKTYPVLRILEAVEFRDEFRRWSRGVLIGTRKQWLLVRAQGGREYEVHPAEVRPIKKKR